MTRTEHKKTHHWKTSLNHSQSKLVAHTEVFKISQDLSIFYSIPFYTITWLLCVFSLVVAHDLLEDWRIDCVIIVSGLVFVSFHAPKIPQDLEFLLYIKRFLDKYLTLRVLKYLRWKIIYVYNICIACCGSILSFLKKSGILQTFPNNNIEDSGYLRYIFFGSFSIFQVCYHNMLYVLGNR